MFTCSVHGECVLGRETGGVKSCTNCPDYDYGPVGKRHLVYHLMPSRAGAAVWRRGVDRLRSRWELFTGHKVVSVATGPDVEPYTEVLKHLPPGCEMVFAPNNPVLGEVTSWVPLWERVLPHTAPGDAILYAHSKGVTRPDEPGSPTRKWVDLMYSVLLDRPHEVDAQLRTHPITGSFKKVGKGFPGVRDSAWHYSGTFYWVRAGDFARRPWRKVPKVWAGTEAWVGTAYGIGEGGCLFREGRVPELNLYDQFLWLTSIDPLYREWVARESAAPIPAP